MGRAPATFLPPLKRIWLASLNWGFGLLCLRFLVAAGRDLAWPVALLGGVGFALGCWRPAAGLLLLPLCAPLVSGLEITVLSLPYSAIMTVASALWLGTQARRLLPAALLDREALESRPSAPPANRFGLLVDVLATIALVSLFIQVFRQGLTPGFWRQSSHGGTDPSYFLTAGFVWLQGLFYFRGLREAGGIAPAEIRLVFVANSSVLLFFLWVQWQFDLPARWTPGFQSPFEDIATLGIMACCCLIFWLAQFPRRPWPSQLLHGLGAAALVLAVVASWSRGTWLAAAVFLGALLLLRLPRIVALCVSALLLAVVVLLNFSSVQVDAPEQPYFRRLVSLVRFENPREKSSARFDLYYKAWSMIRVHPVTGHGLGSFYAQSPRYARRGDPNPHLPQFAHNIVLQLAAEQGVPAASLFLVLVGCSLARGLRRWSSLAPRLGTNPLSVPASGEAQLFLALALTLGAYVQANMTWEILLVHPSQPYFFWFLVGALWTTRTGPTAGTATAA